MSNPPLHAYEFELTLKNHKGEASKPIPMEFVSQYPDTVEKAADLVAKVLTANSNGGAGKFSRCHSEK